jgi:hypothetical protein
MGLDIPAYTKILLSLIGIGGFFYLYISVKKKIYLLFLLISILSMVSIFNNSLFLSILIFSVFILGLISTKDLWWLPLTTLQFLVIASYFYSLESIFLDFGISFELLKIVSISIFGFSFLNVLRRTTR